MKAVIEISGRQYLVVKGDEITVSRLQGDDKKVTLEPLAVFNDASIAVGKPTVTGAKVTAEITSEGLGPKTTSIRFKAKKRVKKIRGARQTQTTLKITAVNAAKSK